MIGAGLSYVYTHANATDRCGRAGERAYKRRRIVGITLFAATTFASVCVCVRCGVLLRTHTHTLPPPIVSASATDVVG